MNTDKHRWKKEWKGTFSVSICVHLCSSVAILLLALVAFAPIKAAAVDEPPIIGQPDNFSGAVGIFRVAASASPVEVPEGDPVLFRVRITSKGPARQGPSRPNLRKLKSFKNRFVIQDLPALDVVSRLPEGQA